jgi:hypothetical protein
MTCATSSNARPSAPAARPWQAALLGLGLLVGLGAQSYAAEPGLQGRWAMAPEASSFREAVTGPRPDTALLVVTRDDRDRFAYQLVESRDGAEVARAAYDVSFAGGGSTSSVEGRDLAISAARDSRGDVVLRAPPIGASQAAIHVRRTGPDTALLEHEIETAGGVLRLETIALVRMNEEGNSK